MKQLGTPRVGRNLAGDAAWTRVRVPKDQTGGTQPCLCVSIE